MSFLTEYFDEFRQHPLKKRNLVRPESRFAELGGRWYDPKKGRDDKEWTDKEINAFIKETTISMRGQSTYFNEYCAHLDPEFKTRPFVPRKKPRVRCGPTQAEDGPKAESAVDILNKLTKLDLIDTEVMKMARDLYKKEKEDIPTLKPIRTNQRIFGYSRPQYYKTGISEYQGGISRLAYEIVRDNRLPKYINHNGGRPDWGYPPEKERQPELDIAPYVSERLY